ncbi:RhoGAP-domain-containing protein [Ophiobolus disseminans]|uniref:RhoGAP-domain-containing protein n=1 Tax=Ophiobolus disseminans TaxID=1469910 RepID=A0A6A6ZX38_9PLEO|nr:RhoGAP-domain-containing protein [Ophiobolus disseminans]
MPNPGTHNYMHTPRVRNGEPQPTAVHTPEPASAKRDLTSWWRQFSKKPTKKDEEKEALLPGIFGVPLIQSIPYANVAISLFNEHGESYIYGYVPIVVAKCGVYLKEKATDVEGIFRLAGSEKRIKELKAAFDTPPRYGKGLDWTGYTVHDAANILRRYFNNLPEPIIPLGNYDPFRQPLRGHQAEAVGHIEGQDPSTGGFDPDAAVRTYQHHIKGLPSLNRQLLLYILDLLAVFAAKSDVNKMTTHNLAAIFQPGILSHPQHDMSPTDYRLSQDVLIFLIDNQDHFLIGMEGTAVDEGTVKHVESGPPTPQARTPTTPGRNGSGIGRSTSNSSSAGAESVKKFNSSVRRNVSTSSKHSRRGVPSPITPAFTTPTTSGVHRSNTLPSKRSPALNSPRFPREKSGPSTPSTEEVKSPLSSPIAAEAAAIIANLGPVSKSPVVVPQVVTEPSLAPAPAPVPVPAKPAEEAPEETMPKRAQTMPPEKIKMPPAVPLAAMPQGRPAVDTPAINSIPGSFPLPSPGIIPPSEDVTPSGSPQAASELLVPQVPVAGHQSPHLTPTRERSEFVEAPIDSGLAVEPTQGPRTFTQILKVAASPSSDGKDGRKPNKLQKKRAPSSTNPSAHSSTHSLTGGDVGAGAVQAPAGQHSPLHPPQLPFAQGYSQGSGSKENLHYNNSNDAGSSRNSGTTLKPSMSPSTSFRSHSTATEYSEVAEPTEEAKEEKRSFWKSHKRGDSRATPTASQTDLHGSVPGGDKSMSSFGSSSGWGGGSRRSLQYDSIQNNDLSTAYGSPPDHEKPEKKGGFGDWFSKMRIDHKDRSDRRERAKSPPGSSSYLPAPQNLRTPPQDVANGRGRSMDMSRPTAEDSKEVTPTGSTSHPPAAPPPVASDPDTVGLSAVSRQEAQPSAAPQSVHSAVAVPIAQMQHTASNSQPIASHSQSAANDFATQPAGTNSTAHSGQVAPIGSDSQAPAPRPTTPIRSSQPTSGEPGTDATLPASAPFAGS